MEHLNTVSYVTVVEIMPGFCVPRIMVEACELEIGRADIALSTNTGGAVERIHNVWVHPSYRRQQIGSLLLQEAVGWSRNHGLLQLSLTCKRNLVRFYEINGFEKTSFVAMCIELKTG